MIAIFKRQRNRIPFDLRKERRPHVAGQIIREDTNKLAA